MKLAVIFVCCLSACGTRVPVIQLDEVPKQTLADAQKVDVYLIGQETPTDYQYVESIVSYSVKHLLTDPPATKGNALMQAKVMCVQKGGNALMNVSFDSQGTDAWGTNAWESITCTGDVVKLRSSGNF